MPNHFTRERIEQIRQQIQRSRDELKSASQIVRLLLSPAHEDDVKRE
jgi:hypothetical protein